MIIVSRFTTVRKGTEIIATGIEAIPCPLCGGKLDVHGTCTRTLKGLSGLFEKLRLRVMECTDCGCTHRELLEGMVPYKRYSVELLCSIFEEEQDTDDPVESNDYDEQAGLFPDETAIDGIFCEPTVQKRVAEWVSWFLTYVQTMNECAVYSRNSQGNRITTLISYLNQCIQSIVNAGRWKIQHHFVVRGS